MGLYPKVEYRDKGCLSFSVANEIAGFETVNDKVLKEMNARASRQLQRPSKTNRNIFDMKGEASRSPAPSPRTRTVGTPTSRRRPPKFVNSELTLDLRPQPELDRFVEGTSSPKRHAALLESPTKRFKALSVESPRPARSPSPSLRRSPRLRSLANTQPPRLDWTLPETKNVNCEPLLGPELVPQKSVLSPVKPGLETLPRKPVFGSVSKEFVRKEFGRSASTFNLNRNAPANENMRAPERRILRTTTYARGEAPSYARPTFATLQRSRSCALQNQRK